MPQEGDYHERLYVQDPYTRVQPVPYGGAQQPVYTHGTVRVSVNDCSGSSGADRQAAAAEKPAAPMAAPGGSHRVLLKLR